MFKTFINNPLIYLFRKMWYYAKGNRRAVVIFTTFFIVAGCIQTLEPLIIGKFLNTAQIEGIHADNLLKLLFLLGIFVIQEGFFWLLHGPGRIIENKNAFIVRANYKRYLLKGVMALPIEWHTDHHSGNTIDKIEKGTTALFSFSCRTFDMIYGFMFLFTSFIALLIYDIKVGILVIGISVLAFSIILYFDSILVPGYRKVNRLENAIGAKVFDILSNVTTVIILRVESLVYGSFSKTLDKPFDQFNKNNTINEGKWFASSMLGRLAVFGAIAVYIVVNLKSGAILIGTIYILYGYANQVRNTFFKFSYLYSDIVRYRTSVDNSEELAKNFQNLEASGNQKLPANWNTLGIENLSFSYHTEDNADLHLDDVALDIRNGQRIAVIGDSGGGKSTFLKLFRDLYHPKTLQLTLDGKELPYGFSGISDSISLVPQDPEIFATTIRENITLGVEYSDEHIKKFTDIAQFTDVAEGLPHKLESSIVEKGVNLSGGEKQRLALARGLLASEDKDIVLLDEPTSSVDTANELAIYQNIFEAFKGKTIISSIHRLHLLKFFDIIYFFRDGKIITKGTFAELKDNSPEFGALWKTYTRTEHIEE